MKSILYLLLFSICWANILTVNVPSCDFTLNNDRFTAINAAHVNPYGMPDVPCRVITIALPPGAKLSRVDFHGSWRPIGNIDIKPALPPVPLDFGDAHQDLQRKYEQLRAEFHKSGQQYPVVYGKIVSRGGLRKYSMVTIACHHFAYIPSSMTLLHSPEIEIVIEYSVPDPNDGYLQQWRDLMNDVTLDREARRIIYNWDQAQAWYHTDTPQRANGYYIILPSALTSSVNELVTHRQNQGYDVQIVTKEYIETNINGIDIQEKFRNYLRANMVNIEYALLVGFSSDMPWRNLVPFNNDPDSPWDNLDYSPIPSDLYLAELTDPDSLSWNSDRDSFYGEVYDENFQPVGEDDPDYHADIRLGRIPFSTASVIEDIINKLIAFDINTDIGYKTAGLLTGALYYYANENNGGNNRMDGAEYCEQFLIDSIISRSNAVTLYEKEGLAPCSLACTDTLNEANHIAYWQNKGIMYECHHGNVGLYARKLWAWDDGDGIPESNEITWPTSFQSSDVYQLDNSHPSTCFLRSCLCGKPEQTGLGAMLLYRGGSAVISSSRVSWASSADINGIPYHFYSHLIKDTLTTRGIIGPSYDIARTIYMDNTNFWLPAYHYNLFGDPALRQYGRLVGIKELKEKAIATGIAVFPNPSKGRISLLFKSGQNDNPVITIYDICGRKIRSINYREFDAKSNTIELDLPPGVYFMDPGHGNSGLKNKIVIIE